MSRPARRQQRRRRRRVALAPPPPPAPPPPGPSLGRIALGALVWLAGSVTYFLLFAVRETTARGFVDGARWLTGGHPRAMAIAGWLAVFAVFGLIWVLLLIRRRVPRGWLFALGAVIVALSPTMVALFPMQGFPIVHLISGAGGSGFVTGMRWGAAAAVIPFLVVPFALVKEAPRGPTTAGVVLFVVATLIGAPLTA
ncbi:hypothetical protein Aph02nite_51830 [Actinoplanes philippinensis]|uniref:Uncharacterized protein n=1 Tax=Actinoplanes philippinensis TaxID=35752 RepID=A0A1I2IKF0_9ACTN|nr:hypothetical protein [Actinoplanes philippinensis]GIE79233.1 hypothetical protein Aph02nite_51830 [Actinoplanes philippinensis]SFF42872.1 hypothetical protein SAMN05421541_110176 [Actinoplanes philippinensis]